MRRRGKCIGLALGGGGARGLAHIGVLKVFEEEMIPIDILAGTSIGALVGGAYAAGMKPADMENKVDEYFRSPEFHSSALKAFELARARADAGLTQKIQGFLKDHLYMLQAIFKPGILAGEDFKATIDFFIPDIQIEEARLIFRAVATDLVSGEQIVFSRGSLRQAVMASCAVPGAIEPIRDGERVFSNGGILCLVPISVAREEGAEIVIAVAVDREICTIETFRNVFGVFHRAGEIMANRLKSYELKNADIVIYPKTADLHWSDFSQARGLIEEGERVTRENLQRIRDAPSAIKKWLSWCQTLKLGKKGQKL
jgi:NTE family protein